MTPGCDRIAQELAKDKETERENSQVVQNDIISQKFKVRDLKVIVLIKEYRVKRGCKGSQAKPSQVKSSQVKQSKCK